MDCPKCNKPIGDGDSRVMEYVNGSPNYVHRDCALSNLRSELAARDTDIAMEKEQHYKTMEKVIEQKREIERLTKERDEWMEKALLRGTLQSEVRLSDVIKENEELKRALLDFTE